MFSLRSCAATVSSRICALRTSVLSNVGTAREITVSPFRTQNFSSLAFNKNTPESVSQSFLSALPALSFNNSTISNGVGNGLLFIPSRTIMKIFWPRPRENKRIKKFGWKARMATPGGRRVIMRRILRGRHILTH